MQKITFELLIINSKSFDLLIMNIESFYLLKRGLSIFWNSTLWLFPVIKQFFTIILKTIILQPPNQNSSQKRFMFLFPAWIVFSSQHFEMASLSRFVRFRQFDPRQFGNQIFASSYLCRSEVTNNTFLIYNLNSIRMPGIL